MNSTALDSFQKALQLTANILFKPFCMKKWLKLGFLNIFIGLGGGGNGGNCNFNFPEKNEHEKFSSFTNCREWLEKKSALLAVIIPIIAVLITIIFLVLMWISAVFNFVFLENVIKNQAFIQGPFSRLKSRGTSYFLWSLAFLVIFLFLAGTAVVFPIALAIASKVFSPAREHLLVIIPGIIYLIFAFFIILFSAVIIAGLTKDFVLPIMYFENIKIIAAWKKYVAIFRENLQPTVIYLILKILVWIIATIYSLFATIAELMVLGIPTLVLGLIVFFGARALGIGWSPTTLTAVIVFAIMWLILFIYLLACLMVPVEVYRRCFALHFLGSCKKEWECFKII